MRKELLVAALPMAFACSFGDPPSWDGASSVAPLPPSLATLPVAVTSAAAPVTTKAPTAAPPVASSAPPPAASSAKPPEPPSPEIGDPGKLPQTEEKPQAAGKDFDLRMTALWDAIVHDDPERAMGTYFPLAAYEQVKDIPNPPSDYKARLIASYKRDIHFFHKWLGPSAETAKFVRVEVPDRARWVPLHQELNKISYWRVFGTRMFFNDEGKERFIELSTMISWRGQWYVVHVRPVK